MLAQVYLIYLFVSIAITIWVGRTLHKNGRIFLVYVFKNNEALADSINHLLLVGFYLINLGFISYTLKGGNEFESWATAIEFLSTKVGFIIVVLGVMHFFNMFVLVRFRDFKLLQPYENSKAIPAANTEA